MTRRLLRSHGYRRPRFQAIGAPLRGRTRRCKVLRVHFTAEDLARTRVVTWGPLAETLFSSAVVQQRAGRALFGPWRDRLRHRQGPGARALAVLYPPSRPLLDLFTLVGDVTDIEQAVEALRGLPQAALATEVQYLATVRSIPDWVARLGTGQDRPEREHLARAVIDHYRWGIAEYWAPIQAHLQAERASRGRAFLDGGIDRLLATLGPFATWRHPVLELADPVLDRAVHLHWRGLLLVPSVFCWPDPLLLIPRDEATPNVLFYPALRDPVAAASLWALGHRDHHALASLLGPTRAVILEILTDSCTTSELAKSANVSLATASRHAAVLRDTGLITTRRHGASVLHTLTSLGANLLDQTQ